MTTHHQHTPHIRQADSGRRAYFKLDEMERLSGEKYRLVVENAHEAIFIVQDHVLKFANAQTEFLTGYTKSELALLPFTELLHPEYRSLFSERYRKKLDGEQLHEFDAFKAVTKSGTSLWVRINSIRVDLEGRPALLCFVKDITRTKKMEGELLQAQKMQAIGTLSGGIAHDFNNILSAIMGYSELCLSDEAADSVMARRLNRILQACNRARDLIHQILTFARQEDQERKPIKVGPIIKEALKLLRASIPSNIEFVQRIDSDTDEIMACPTQIHQVVMNLCTNAAHAMQAGGGELTIDLGNCHIDPETACRDIALKPGGHICLTVSDTGTGMPPDILKRIFDPYFTQKKHGNGTGLGLSVVHGIVSNLGGAIHVASEPEKGSVFKIWIPAITSVPEPDIPAPPPVPDGTETILLVDDEDVVLDMLTEMLTGMGYTVIPRISSVEAFHAFSADPERFDLVFTDQTMPKMTGMELASRIHRINPTLPIVLCTGFSVDIDKADTLANGIKAVTNKPLLKREVAQAIRSVLDANTK